MLAITELDHSITSPPASSPDTPIASDNHPGTDLVFFQSTDDDYLDDDLQPIEGDDDYDDSDGYESDFTDDPPFDEDE